MRPIRVTTETAIPTVFQVELAEVAEMAEVGVVEGVDEGETVGFQEVTSGTVAPFDGEITRVPDEVDKATADLVEDEV